MIRPDGHIVIFDVKGDVPYLRRRGQYNDANQNISMDTCGVMQKDGVIVIQHALPDVNNSDAAPALQADDGNDSVFERVVMPYLGWFRMTLTPTLS